MAREHVRQGGLTGHGERRSGGHRGRGDRRGASTQLVDDTARNRVPRNRSSHGHRGNPRKGSLHVLPDDIVAQSLLPLLVWRDSSALGSVNRSWSLSVRLARRRSTEWKTTTHGGDNPRVCLVDMAARLGRGGTEALCFAPVLALATLSFASFQDARQAEAVWKELVAAIGVHDILPVGCVLVGLLDGAMVGENGLPVRREGQAAVNVTISMGHFGQTVVDTAVFDRKALRWSASGLTEELECPFEQIESKESERASLLVWSTSGKSAQALLALAAQWYPNAAVGGAVLARADHAPALMTYTRLKEPPQRPRIQAQRKAKVSKSSRVGVPSCPSALMIRLRGDVFVRPLELCLDRPLTPILKNEALTLPDAIDLTRRDTRVYQSVSVVDFDNGSNQSHSLDTIVGYHMERGGSSGGIITLYSSPSASAIRVALLPEMVKHYDTRYRHTMEEVRSIALYVDQHGMLTVDDHWEVGHFGIVTLRCCTNDIAFVIGTQIRQLFDVSNQAAETVLGSVVLYSTEIDDGSSPVILAAIKDGLRDVSRHECFVGSEVGPIVMPGSRGNNPFQLQTGTVGGFVLCRI